MSTNRILALLGKNNLSFLAVSTGFVQFQWIQPKYHLKIEPMEEIVSPFSFHRLRNIALCNLTNCKGSVFEKGR